MTEYQLTVAVTVHAETLVADGLLSSGGPRLMNCGREARTPWRRGRLKGLLTAGGS